MLRTKGEENADDDDEKDDEEIEYERQDEESAKELKFLERLAATEAFAKRAAMLVGDFTVFKGEELHISSLTPPAMACFETCSALAYRGKLAFRRCERTTAGLGNDGKQAEGSLVVVLGLVDDFWFLVFFLVFGKTYD